MKYKILTYCSRGIALLATGIASAAMAATTVPDCSAIKIVEPYPPGAITNVVARMVSEHITQTTGKSSYIENRPGASGNIGSAYVARRSKPDGCTILIGTDATHAGNYYLFENFPYHPVDDFTPLAKAGTNMIVLVGRPDVPADTLPELVEFIKVEKSPLFYASPGVGSPHHLSGALFSNMVGTPMTHVPFSGGAQAMTNLLGGEFPFLFSTLAVAEPHIRSGAIKAYGVTSGDRFPGLPDIPAINEVIPGIELNSWLAFFGPAGMSPEHVEFYNGIIRQALNSAENKANLQKLGLLVADETPEALAEEQRRDFASRGRLIRENHIQLEP
ncbi:MAG: tripartite tricarboxylate transporter substrate binding protein [Pigmentiphaga sp.]|nr:tripartite tricarboxylate transporter substrate binding protein [Pigmentiphaga sp.]